MAVEIPVVVDIEGAFKEAAKRVDRAIAPLQKQLSQNALKLRFNIDEKTTMTVNKLLTSSKVTTEQLGNALKSVEARITRLQQRGGFIPGSLTGKEKDLLNIYSQLQLKINGATNVLQQYNSVMSQTLTSSRRLNGIFGGLLPQFTALASIHMATRFVKQIRDVTGELEYQRVALGKLIQDEEYGAQLFERIKEAAKESPFRITQLVTYTKQLAAYRIEQENLFDVTKRLADISAGLGVDMNRIILAYGQVRAASVLRGQELRQFTEAGIPLVELLADKFTELRGETVKTADVFKLISERAVPFSMVAEIFEDLTDKGGMFYKMQEEQAKTLKGRWEKLKDAYDIALQTIGESKTFQKYNDVILGVLNAMAKNLTVIVRAVESLGIAWVTYKIATNSAVVSTVKATTAIIKQAGVAGLWHAAISRVTVAWNKLKVAISSNWIGIALTAIASLTTYLFTFRKRADDAADSVSNLNGFIEELAESEKTYNKMNKAIERFERLASKTNRTAQENVKLNQTMSVLREQFPGLTIDIDNENNSLEEQIGLLRTANDLQRSYTLNKAEEQYQVNIAQQNALKDRLIKLEKDQQESYRLMTYYQNAQGQVIEKIRIKKITQESAEYNRLGEEIRKTSDELEKLAKQQDRLDKYLNPEKAAEGRTEWQKLLISMRQYEAGGVTKELFTAPDVEGWNNFSDAIKNLAKEYNNLKTAYEGYLNVSIPENIVSAEWNKEKDEATAAFDAISLLDAALGGLLSKSGKGGKGSDTRLSDLRKDIGEITNAYKKFLELRKYMGEKDTLSEIGKLFPQIKWTPDYAGTIAELKRKLAEVKAQLSSRPGDKTLLEMQRVLDTEISNLEFDALRKKTDDELKRMSDELKRSETARNFYNNILGLTGDQELATSVTMSVYGGVGEDFKERLQKELYSAIKTVPVGDISQEFSDELSDAIATMNMGYLRSNLDKLPDRVRDVFQKALDEAEKFDAKWVEDIIKTYEKTKDFEERITDVRAREAEARRKINDKIKDPAEREKLIAASTAKEAKDVAAIRVEELKNTYEWTKAFSDLERIGNETLVNLRKKILEVIEAEKDGLTPEQLKALREELEKIRKVEEERSPLSAISSGGRKAMLITSLMGEKEGTSGYDLAIKKIKEFNEKAEEADKIDLNHLEDSLRDANTTMEEGIQGLSDYLSKWKDVVDTVTEAFSLDEVPVLGEALQGISDALSFVATILPVIITLNQVLNTTLLSNPFIAAAAAIVATIGLIAGIIKGIINAKIERLNKKIDEQADLIEDLEYQYDRLEKAIAKSFGSDYISNFNQQLANLEAQQEAYLKQAQLERDKGKKSDEEKIKEYEKSARDTADQIRDMQGQLSEFFSGTDITSAAKDFANSWIEAYKEFGSTTDAMKERFQEMIQEMVEKSLAAKVMQELLSPIFKEIDRLAQEGGELSAEDIALVADLAKNALPNINDSMTALMNTLAAAGYNLRQSPGQFTGISRNIANATEESITGLAAGINTQNFYISTISQNVAAILSVISGGNATPVGSSAISTGTEWTTHVSTINENLSQLLLAVKSVIYTDGQTVNKRVAIR